MSLIERALHKAKEPGEAATPTTAPPLERRLPDADKAPVPPTKPPAKRVAEGPQVIVNEERLRELGLRAEPGQYRQQRAEFRHVKRQLLSDLRSTPMNRLVLVASALEGEGKSFTAANLALSMSAEPDYAVLLIDGDVIRPSLSGMFGLADRKGLMDAVVDATLDPESLIASTSVEGFSILPAGTPNENATEHFGSARMREVIEQLMSVPNRVIILDSLPLLLSTEARVLAPHAGQVLLVVRAESTPKPAVRQALALLAEHKNVKVLLNAVVWTKMLDYMIYGYGYGYEYGAVENGNKK